MALVLSSGPASEPVTVAEAKAHLRLDGAAEDLLIASLILTSRLHIEAAMGLALITQGWKLILDRWPEWPEVPISLKPVQAVTSVTVLAADGTPAVMAASDYILDRHGSPARLIRTGASWPAPGRIAAGIEIAFTAGFSAAGSDVPAPIRQALLMLIAHWYEHRDPFEIGSPVLAIPSAVSDILAPYREARL